ncbi:MAG: ROK family protein [Candidatus Dormibacteraeota bacterium]|nr:ROK family protein [Candidatus Dormibacteraeota bacterium]
MGLLGTRGPSSRAEIARELNVSPATVTQTTRELIARNLVAELGCMPSHGGRPGRLVGLVRTAGSAIGAKVAADHVAIVDVELDGTIRSSAGHQFDAFAPDALERLCRILADAIKRHDGLLLGVGVGVPGSVDDQASGVVDAPTIGWKSAPVGRLLRARLGVPVLVDNDVNTLAAAERIYGVGRTHASYVVVTIGAGVGSGIVVDGAIYRGATGSAGEIGHIPVSEGGPVCACGSRGCLEAHIGTAALLSEARVRGILGDRGDQRALRKLAQSGNAGAMTIYRNAGTLLGGALAGLVLTLDPEIVVILGEGIEAWEFWETAFESAFRRQLMATRRGIPFVVESWNDDQWARGAASLVVVSPFDASRTSGEQGRLVRARLQMVTPVRL